MFCIAALCIQKTRCTSIVPVNNVALICTQKLALLEIGMSSIQPAVECSFIIIPAVLFHIYEENVDTELQLWELRYPVYWVLIKLCRYRASVLSKYVGMSIHEQTKDHRISIRV